jgi:predicted RNA binding protein YcfA (HicA-like mRNA interferase family)
MGADLLAAVGRAGFASIRSKGSHHFLGEEGRSENCGTRSFG